MMKQINLKNSSGFSLIEGLVVLVIMSIGMLGLAGLQVKGLKSNQNAYLRSQATIMANDMAERIRANSEAVAQESIKNYSKDTTHAKCLDSGCTGREMLENDIAQWEQQIHSILEDAVAVVCLDSSPNDGVPADPGCTNTGNVYAIKIWWSETNEGETSTSNFSMSFIP